MSAETLLNQLAKVRKNGVGKWMACCPAHDDRTPSLSVKEGEDGHILIHCFAGCSLEEILGAVGLEMGALFPERSQHSFNDIPPTYYPKERETKLKTEKENLEFRIMVYLRMIKNGKRFTSEEDKKHSKDFERLQELRRNFA